MAPRKASTSAPSTSIFTRFGGGDQIAIYGQGDTVTTSAAGDTVGIYGGTDVAIHGSANSQYFITSTSGSDTVTGGGTLNINETGDGSSTTVDAVHGTSTITFTDGLQVTYSNDVTVNLKPH